MAAKVSSVEPTLDLEDFFENGTVGLHLVGPDGTILRANRADYEPLGYSAHEYVGRSITDFHADADTIVDILRRLSAGERLDKYPARLRAKDGSIRHVIISSSVCFRAGEFANTRCFTVDVTEKVEAETALQEAQDRLAATYESLLAGIGECDADGRFLRVNEAFVAITGYSREELLEKTFFDMTHPEDIEREKREFGRQVGGQTDQYRLEKRYVRSDGQIIWVEVTSSTVRDDAGGFSYGVRMVQDITDKKLAEQQKKLLLDELNHRVKNTLATVQALAAQTARNSSSAEDFRRRFEPRLMALSAAHDRLTQNDWRGADLGDIVAGELAAYRQKGRSLTIEGPSLVLPPKTSLSLSMALHELATNAAKYGAMSVPHGRVEVRWSVGRQAGNPYPTSLSVSWIERGGPAPQASSTEGFGTKLLRVTAAELAAEARTELTPLGLEWRLEMPLPQVNRNVAHA